MDETKAFLIGVIVCSFLAAAFLTVLTIASYQYSAHVRDVNLQKWEACHEKPTYPCNTSDNGH